MMGRKPACSTPVFEATSTTSGLVEMHGKYNTIKLFAEQGLPFGNRIGHCPYNPKCFTPPEHHKRPISLLEVIRDFKESYFEIKLHKALYHHFDKEGKGGRQIRSEFREMISMGCAILTHYYDVTTGEIGFINQFGKSIRLSYEQLADILKVSLIRVKRFFKFLKNRNFITIIEDKKKDDKGNWKSNVSKKVLNPSFFIETLGIKAWRKICSYKEWLFKKSKPKTIKQKDNLSLVKNIFSSIGVKKVKNHFQEYTKNTDQERNLIHEALQRYERDPSRSLSDYLKELKEPHNIG